MTMISGRTYLSFVLLVFLFACEASDKIPSNQAKTQMDTKLERELKRELESNLENKGNQITTMDANPHLLVIELSISEKELADGKVIIESRVSNVSKQSIKLLSYNSPLDISVLGPIFEIEYGGEESREPLSYTGLMAKRLPPGPEDYIEIRPSEVVSQTLDITASYKFCSNKQYSVSFERDLFDDSVSALAYKAGKTFFKPAELFSQC